MKLNTKYNSPLWLGLGLTVTLVVIAFIVWGRLRTDIEVPMAGMWKEPVILCASEEINIVELNKALSWWAERGYVISINCENPNYTMEVDPTLDIRSSVDDIAVQHGLTNCFVDPKTNEIDHAVTRVLPRSEDLVLAHEIGHGLGFLHFPLCPTGHIMHQHNAGWDDRGIPRR